RNPEASRHRLWIGPRFSLLRSAFKGLHHRCAAGRLDGEEPRHGVLDPAGVAQLLKRLPHSDQTGATARRVDDGLGEAPPELLGELDAHRFLAFDPVRLPQRRDVKCPALGSKLAGGFPAVPDVTVHQDEISPKGPDLLENRGRGRPRGEYVNRNTSAARIGGKRYPGIPGSGYREFLDPAPDSTGDGRGKPAGLERAGWVL